jgi:hypothetical protein
MNHFTPEVIAKAKATRSAEELLEIAKANGVELTAEEAKTYFEQLHVNSAVSDDDLDTVAGGACGTDGEAEEETAEETAEEERQALPAGKRICPACKTSVPMNIRKCPSCQKLLNARV